MRVLVGLFISLLAGGALAQPAANRAMLGVGSTDVPSTIAQRGAWVHQVRPGSAAALAGVQPNDVIIAIDDQPIGSAAELIRGVGARAPGSVVVLQILRPNGNNAERLQVSARLGTMPEAAAATAADSGAWTTFTDPIEQAFSTEVPQGWRVEGGTARHSSISPAMFLRLLSPDGRTYLMFGDPKLTLFTTLSRPQVAQGVREGQAAGPGITLSRYLPGIEFARTYLGQAIPSVCADVVVTGQRSRPDLAQGAWAQSNPNAQHAGGEVSFTCNHAGSPAVGAIMASSYIYRVNENYGGSLWAVEFLAGFVTLPDATETATAELVHIAKAWHMNPGWVEQQRAATDQYSRGLVANAQRTWQFGEEQTARAQARMHAMDKQVESFDRVLTGSSPYADAAGNTYQLDNTKTQWRGPNGQTLGTNGASPGSGWQQLREVPPQ